jgi:hypothetical protein
MELGSSVDITSKLGGECSMVYLQMADVISHKLIWSTQARKPLTISDCSPNMPWHTMEKKTNCLPGVSMLHTWGARQANFVAFFTSSSMMPLPQLLRGAWT